MRADKKNVTRLLKTAHGQMSGILKMVDEDKYCIDILNQLLACDAIIKKASKEILQSHITGCVSDAFQENDADEQKRKIDEIALLLDKLSK
jgi:Uncharacterized protein conserved in bacteria